MAAEGWQVKQEMRMRRAAELAADGREVFLVDQSDEDWTFD